jgi:hypothetical protein
MRNQRAVVGHPFLLIAIVVVAAVVGVLSFVPSGTCNVSAKVSMSEVQFIVGSEYSVNSVSASNAGYSSVLNWGTLAFTWPALTSKEILTVSVGGHSAQRDETQVLASLSVGSKSVSDTVTVGYVPKGEQTVTADLVVNGADQGSQSTTVDVEC